MAFHRILRWTQEAAFATFPGTSPVSGYIRCDTPNIFKPMLKPDFWTIPDGSGLNVPALRGSSTVQVKGRLRTRLCASNAAFLLGWAGTKVDATQMFPWATSEPVGDLASAALDFGWTLANQSTKRQRNLGVKVAGWQLDGQMSANDPFLWLTLDLIGAVTQGNVIDSSSDPTATAFPEPTAVQLPSDYYLFRHLAGGISIGGTSGAPTARTNCRKISIKGTNKVQGYWDENVFANRIRCNGRSITATYELLLKNTPYDRTTFESTANIGFVQAVFTQGAKSVTINLNGQNVIDDLEEDLVMDEDNYYTLTLQNLMDTTAANDGLTITVV